MKWKTFSLEIRDKKLVYFFVENIDILLISIWHNDVGNDIVARIRFKIIRSPQIDITFWALSFSQPKERNEKVEQK